MHHAKSRNSARHMALVHKPFRVEATLGALLIDKDGEDKDKEKNDLEHFFESFSHVEGDNAFMAAANRFCSSPPALRHDSPRTAAGLVPLTECMGRKVPGFEKSKSLPEKDLEHGSLPPRALRDPISFRELMEARAPVPLTVRDLKTRDLATPRRRQARAATIGQTHYDYFARHLPDESPDHRQAMSQRVASQRSGRCWDSSNSSMAS